MVVYHWTTEDNALSILLNGLREDSFVCKNPDDWEGDVCLEIDGDTTFAWEGREPPADWQAVTEFIPPERIKRL